MKHLIVTFFVCFFLSTVAQKWEPVNKEFDSLLLKCENIRNTIIPDKDYSLWIERMHDLAKIHNSDVMEWRTLFFEAWLDQAHENMTQGEQKVKLALEMVDSVRYPYDYHRIWWGYNRVYVWRRNYPSIYKHAREELLFYTKAKDDMMIGLMYMNIYDALVQSNLYDKAAPYDTLIRLHYKKAGFEEALIHRESEVIRFYLAKGDTVKAKELYTTTLANRIKRDDDISLFILYDAVVGTDLEPEAAPKAFALAQKIPIQNRRSILPEAHLLMGDYLFEIKNDPAQALHHYRFTLDNNVDSSGFLLSQRLPAYGGLSQCYSALERWDSAYKYLSLYNALNDSLEGLADRSEFNELYAQSQLELQEERYANMQAQRHNRMVVAWLVVIILLLGASAVIWYLLMHKRLKESENLRLANDLEREQLEKELLQARTENSERQLTTNSLLLIEKRKMIDHLNKEITERGDKEHLDPKLKRDLLNFIKMHQGTEENLSQFYDYFNQVHPVFFKALKERCPSLTKSNLRLCAYIRIGLDNKQIAQILSVQPEAVKMARHRLRAKIGLSKEDSLEDYVMGI